MKEFMLLIRNSSDKNQWSEELHQKFVKKCEVYITNLKVQGKLIAAQPLIREGVVLSKSTSGWGEKSIDINSEIQVGYYHILAETIEEAVTIAKLNPEFEFGAGASIEIRPIKNKETTGLTYPSQKNSTK